MASDRRTTTHTHKVGSSFNAERTGRLVWSIALTFLAIAFLAPFYWMLVTSLKSSAQMYRYPPVWFPRPIEWSNYAEAVRTIPFFLYIRNTVLYAALSIVGAVVSNSIVAYGFARLQVPFKKVLFGITLITLMVSAEVTMIPIFLLMRALGWTNTYAPLVVPHYFGNAFFIFLLRQFFLTIPEELRSSGRIDGAGEMLIFRRIMLPLCRPALAVVVLLQFIYTWRDYLGPLIYLNNEKRYPISLGLTQFLDVHGPPQWGPLMAACVLTLVPILALFLLFQRFFIQGIAMTGLRR